MNLYKSAVLTESIDAVGACKLCLLFVILATAGCANPPSATQPVELMSRDDNIVSHGTVSSHFPRTTRLVVDVDRRIYVGNSAATAPNQTFGFVHTYGHGRYNPATSALLESRSYQRAVLSSTDNHILRCDFRNAEGQQLDGICVDDFGRIYDVVTPR
jgi:hypothetical protein